MKFIQKARSLLKNSQVLKNGLWLYIMQFGNMVIPLITLTYVTKVLGPERYGVFSVAINIIGYFQVFVDYGFGLSGSRKIAIDASAENTNKTFTGIFFSRLLLCVVSYAILYILGWIISFEKSQWVCLNILFLTVIGASLMQTWLFQGLQKMKFVTCITLFSRIVSAICILLFIKDSSDIYLYCVYYSLTNLLVGIISIVVAKITTNIKIVKISLRELFVELKDGWYTFTTSLMSKLFGGIGITLIAAYGCSNDRIGIYSAINKIPHLLVSLYLPISQAIFPYISKLYSECYEKGLAFIKKVVPFVAVGFAFMSLGLIIFRDIIIKIAFSQEYLIHSMVMLPLVIWMTLSILNNCLGIQILVASGHQKEYSNSFTVAVVVLIVLNAVLGYFFDIYGIAYANAISELVLFLLLTYQVMRLNKQQRIRSVL